MLCGVRGSPRQLITGGAVYSIDHDALQCGFCTPGMVMNAYGLLLKNPHPDREQIIEGMEDNFCRCGAHKRIIEAIESASKVL